MHICCLDLEGILVPEIWLNVAKKFRVKELELTTRDMPDYDKLMRYRLGVLKREGIRLRDIQAVIRTMKPLAGAKGFLRKLQRQMPVILLSDTYYEFAGPLLDQLGNPTLFCNWLKVDSRGMIKGYVLRQRDGKRKAVRALKSLGFRVLAAGDSYNDLTMLQEAQQGVLFRPPDLIAKRVSHYPVVYTHSKLLTELTRSVVD